MKRRKPWGWNTRYRGHKHDEPLYLPDFLRWWRSWWRKRKQSGDDSP